MRLAGEDGWVVPIVAWAGWLGYGGVLPLVSSSRLESVSVSVSRVESSLG